MELEVWYYYNNKLVYRDKVKNKRHLPEVGDLLITKIDGDTGEISYMVDKVARVLANIKDGEWIHLYYRVTLGRELRSTK